VSPALAFTLQPATADLSAAAARFTKDVFQHATAGAPAAGAVSEVVISVATPDAPLQLYINESYTLRVPADGSPIVITSETTVGALHALQTLAQAVRFDFEAGEYAVAGVPLAMADKPKFAWRGLLLDTDRHWQSLSFIRSVLDGMAMAKLNLFHWHIVDWRALGGLGTLPPSHPHPSPPHP
jgi:hexosaminidase